MDSQDECQRYKVDRLERMKERTDGHDDPIQRNRQGGSGPYQTESGIQFCQDVTHEYIDRQTARITDRIETDTPQYDARENGDEKG